MRTLFIDSRDRVSGTTTDFTIQLPETLTIEGKNHKARIDQFRVPLTVPTIQSGANDTILVKVGSQVYTATIPQGNVDGPTLASKIQSSLQNTAPGGWNVSYDISNLSMSISCTNPFTIVGGTYATVQLLSRPYTQTSNSYFFPYVSALGCDVMYLSSPQFSTLDIFGPGGAHDTLMAVDVNLPYGSVLVAAMGTDQWFDVPQMTTQTLSFSLRDRSYNVLSQVPNISFVMMID